MGTLTAYKPAPTEIDSFIKKVKEQGKQISRKRAKYVLIRKKLWNAVGEAETVNQLRPIILAIITILRDIDFSS